MSTQRPRTDESNNRSYYDSFAGWYERERGRGYHGMLDDLELEVLAPFARGRDVLELGCGTGLILERVAPMARTAKGIDLSEGMIAKARERGLDVQVGSVTQLPYPDASFDCVYSFKVLAHVPDLGKAIAEAKRVTRPGGVMVLELYNPMSLRYVAKRLAGPQKISEDRTEADVYTRWDPPWILERILPSGVELVDVRGVRVFTPAAFVHRIPGVAGAIRRAEHWALTSPLRWFGGFMVVVLRRTA